MKEINYTDKKIKRLFITGIILVFIMLFSSFLYPRQSVKYFEIESDFSSTMDSGYCLSSTVNPPMYSYTANPGFCLIKNNKE